MKYIRNTLLLRLQKKQQRHMDKKKQNLPALILNCVALGLSVATVVLSILSKGSMKDIIMMMSSAIVCLSAAMLIRNKE